MSNKPYKVILLGGPADGLIVTPYSDTLKVTTPSGNYAVYKPRNESDMKDAGMWIFEGFEDREHTK